MLLSNCELWEVILPSSFPHKNCFFLLHIIFLLVTQASQFTVPDSEPPCPSPTPIDSIHPCPPPPSRDHTTASSTPKITQDDDLSGMQAAPLSGRSSDEADRLSALQQLSRAAAQSAVRLAAHCESAESIVALQAHVSGLRRQVRRLRRKRIGRQRLAGRQRGGIVPARPVRSPSLSPALEAPASPAVVTEAASSASERLAFSSPAGSRSARSPSPAPGYEAPKPPAPAAVPLSASPAPERPVRAGSEFEAPTTPVKRRKHKSMTPAEQRRILAVLDAKMEEYRESVRALKEGEGGFSPGQ